ncbi:GDSL-type esterase/lipase family protein [Desulfitobacterium metallireducens]|uniref:Lysophospholipase n=1 Tax=Desulfitobacterium metallireducens DSM 15288 TaxID=871968 RepID=W0EFL6_9FIRM|nr:GDSL-type esterase/lipase family protein [Desulfitobacterium metallireducens]AHF07999.1 lysophospholipase [Desulfitobacterium metallireducens DSM 15288]
MRTYRLEIRLIQLSVALSVLVVIVGFLGAWGGSKGQENGAPDRSETAQTQTKTLENTKIVALGDSFTYGYPGKTEQSWVAVLEKSLKVSVVNKGKGYQRTMDLLSRFEADVVAEKPGRIIIFSGNGDALRSVPLEEFQTNIKALVDKSRSNNITPILALPMPYPGVQQTIKEMRTWMLQYAETESIVVLDFASAVMDADNKYRGGFSDDNKYPTAKGYEAMGEYAARVLK